MNSRRSRSIDTSGTTPEPPPTRRIGPPSSGSQLKWPPIGPRISIASPTCDDLMEERRHLADVEAFDDQFDRVAVRGGSDRVAALRLVAVGGGQPDIDMLPGDEGERIGRPDEEALHRRGLVEDTLDRRLLPHEASGTGA